MNYRDIAAQLDVPVCWAACPSTHHDKGWVDVVGKIHWRDRRVNRWGLYRFLKLVVIYRMGLQQARTGPVRTWLLATGAFDLGLSLGVRFSRKIMAEDRTLVRSWLAAGYGQDMDDDTRTKVSRWARA